LLDAGAIAPATLDRDQAEVVAAAARVQAEEGRGAALGKDSQPESRLGAAAARASDLDRRVAGLTLRAPADGVVYGLPRTVGEAVSPGQLIGQVADRDRPRVRVRVDQPDLPRLAPRVALIVGFDGLPDTRFAGLIVRVDPGVKEIGGRMVGEAIGEISDPQHRLPTNASVNVEVVVAEEASALLVPRAAVFRDGERPFVYVVESGRAHRREVVLGLVGANEVESRHGLAEGEFVALPGAVPLRDGVVIAPQA
jgi:membrane fusion protein (multidrug efflux system)